MIIGKVLKTDIKVLIEEDKAQPNRAVFTIQPLASGFGTTVGNALRRVLLSSLSGYSPVAVRVENANHEYDTLPGVVEDVSDIILNLRQLVFSADTGDEEVHVVSLAAKGSGDVTGADFVLPPELKILNPDAYIAGLDSDGELVMDVVLMRGRGYLTAQEVELPPEHDYVGMIPIDAVFTPIVKVNFNIEETRVGQMTNFDKLILDVSTDGSISPRRAVETSAGILINFFGVIGSADARRTPLEEREDEERRRVRELLARPVSELDLSVRSANCLRAADIHTLGDLVVKPEAEMLKYRNFGKKSLAEIESFLSEYGLHLGMDVRELLGEEG
jgi:DNA-directed RNA polymerase subunit alpha